MCLIRKSVIEILRQFTKMPWCVAVGCSNNTFTNNKEKNISFYRFPKDQNLNKRWIQNIKRENPPKDARICHLHFDESCSKHDFQVQKFLVCF